MCCNIDKPQRSNMHMIVEQNVRNLNILTCMFRETHAMSMNLINSLVKKQRTCLVEFLRDKNIHKNLKHSEM